MQLIGYLWAFPVTAFGLLIALFAVLTGGSAILRNRVIEVQGGGLQWLLRGGRLWPGAAAMTLGHVILARNDECLERSRVHELVHVRQFERWGPLLIPMYWIIGTGLFLRGYHPYLDHPLEPPPGDLSR